jgi:hypothetical protein
MALELAGKNPAKFIFDDGVSTTTVTVQPDDGPDAVRAKLQRVLELEAGQGLPVRQPGAALTAAQLPELFDAAGAETRVLAQSTHGWAEDGPDIAELPER